MTTSEKSVKGEPSKVGSRLTGTLGALRDTGIQVGEMCQLLGQVVYTAVRHPRGYWGETRDQLNDDMRRGFFPVAGTVGIFGFVIGSLGYGLLSLLGSAQRMSALVINVSMRETGVFLTAMVVAGVMGASLTADLGARKIRDEIDALRVIGMDPVRLLVLPKAISLVVMMVFFSFVGTAGTILASMLVSSGFNDLDVNVFMNSMLRNMSQPELWGMILKAALSGLLIAIICSYKGLNVGGGPEGVGRAVNQSVVITFIAFFALNTGFNAILVGLFPELQTMR